jgi:hypothetical protein
MTADASGSELKPITPARLAREVAELSAGRRSGKLKPEVYDQMFARMIGELRDRKIDGNRADVVAALTPLKDKGEITAEELQRVLGKLTVK